MGYNANCVDLRRGLDQHNVVHNIAREVGITHAEAFLALFKAAQWVKTHGKYGKMKCDPKYIDETVGVPGFSIALESVGWLGRFPSEDTWTLVFFCSVAAGRKALGKKLRERILKGSVCACCRADSGLEIDHIVPIARGGSCDEDNLQVLCWRCNSEKRTMTMAEFMESRA